MTGDQLHERVREHAEDERHAIVEFLLHLAEIDRRRDYERFGKDSLWKYVHETLAYPECQTFVRTTSARLLRTYPQIAEYLLDGRLSMTTLVELRKVFTPKRAKDLLDRASGKSKRQVRELAASMNAPVTPVAEIRAAPSPAVIGVDPATLALRDDQEALWAASQAAASPEPGSGVIAVGAGQAVLVMGASTVQTITPVATNQKELVVTIDDEFERDLEELGDALSHEFRKKDFAGLLHHCMKKELARIRKRRGIEEPGTGGERAIGQTEETGVGGDAAVPSDAVEPLQESVSSVLDEIAVRVGRVHIRVNLQRAVWKRAENCCEMKLKNGAVCRSRYRCQIDHIRPIAKGGRTELSNLRLLCQQHNLEAARAILGDDFIDQCISRSRAAAKRRRAEKERSLRDESPCPDEVRVE